MDVEPEKRYFALTEAKVDEINSGLGYIEQHYMIPTHPPQLIGWLDWDADAVNRWAAFTTTEIHTIYGWLQTLWDNDYIGNDQGLADELDAELNRRKDNE